MKLSVMLDLCETLLQGVVYSKVDSTEIMICIYERLQFKYDRYG